MTPFESGPARMDRNYWFVVGLGLLAFAGWFVYDGAVRYRNQNIEKAQDRLAMLTNTPVALGEVPTEADFQRVRAEKIATRDELYKILGQPLTLKKGVPSDGLQYFASVYGLASVPVDASGRVLQERSSAWQWTSWGKTKAQMQEQYYWAILPVVGAAYVWLRAYRASKLRAVIDDDGMTYGGLPIPLADMVSLRDYNRKGWVDLYYRRGEQEKRLRIDNQKIARFDEIIDLLCQLKKFPNPVKAYFAAQQGNRAEKTQP